MDFLAMLKDTGTVNALMIVALGLIVFLAKKGLGAFEDNMQKHGECIVDLYNKHTALSNQFNLLLGNHEARHGNLKRRKDDVYEA